MRALERNKTTFYYCLYVLSTPIVDDYGNETGEYLVEYSDPVETRANVSPATGISATEQFGTLDSYDKVIVTDDTDCPIDEHSVLFIDKPPTFDNEGNPLYDYTVRRVAKSLNSVSVAVTKVKVS